jgi:Zn-dependent M28 family amino/carboxypeptidase
MQLTLQRSKPGTRSSSVKIDTDYLSYVVRLLSFPREYGSPENERAERLVADELMRKFFTCERVGKTQNVCFGWPEEARILIGAHFDSVPDSPGADDNASAVAVMLAVAKTLGMRRDVMYVAFNAEECDLAGSRDFVKEMAGQVKKLEQVHVLEMVGYRDRRPNSQKNPLPMIKAPTTGDFLVVVANQGGLVDRIIEAAGSITVPVVGLAIPEGLPLNAIQQISPHLLRSDHAPFWEKNIPAVMWTDTSEFRNPHYHQATDTPDTLDYEFMAEVGKLLVEMVGSKKQKCARHRRKPLE